MTRKNKFAAPWSLHFDRNGTEDIAIICDANGDDLVTSRCFWLSEDGNPIPETLHAMRLMVTAPKLLAALRQILNDRNCVIDRERRLLIRSVIAEEEGRTARTASNEGD